MNSVDDHRVSTANNPEQNPVDARDRTDLSRRPPLGKFALSAVVIAVILGLALNPTFYSETIVSAYSSLAIFGTVIVIGVIRRSWVDLLSILGGTALLYLLDYRVMGFKPAFMSGFSFAGLAAFAVFGIRTVWAQRDERKILLYGLVPVTLFVMSEYLASSMLEVTEKLHPKPLTCFCIHSIAALVFNSVFSPDRYSGSFYGSGLSALCSTSLCLCHWLSSTPGSCASWAKKPSL